MSDAALIQIPLGGGLDETNEDTDVPAERMRVCQNVVFPDPVNCKKRPGLTFAAQTPPNSRKLVPHGNEVLVIDGYSAWAYTSVVPGALAPGSCLLRGFVSPCMASRQLLASGNATLPFGAGGTAFNNPLVPLGSVAEDPVTKLRVYAWTDGVSIQASVWDTVGQNYVITDHLMNASANAGSNSGADFARPRVVIIGSYAYVMYVVNETVSGLAYPIVYRSINLANTTVGFAAEAQIFGSSTSPLAGLNCPPGGAWDACIAYVGVNSTPNIAIAVMYSGAGFTTAAGPLFIYNFAASGGTIPTAVTQLLEINPDTGTSGSTVWTVGSVSISSTPASLGHTAQQVIVSVCYSENVTSAYQTKCGIYQMQSGAPPVIYFGASGTLGSAMLSVKNISSGFYGMQRGVGAVYAPGYGAGIPWLVTFSLDYTISSKQGGVGAQPADHRTATAFEYAIITDTSHAGPSVYVMLGRVGFQTQSKPIQYTDAQGVSAYYVLTQQQDGQRTAGSTTIIANGGQSLVLLQVTVSPLKNVGSSFFDQPQPMAVAAPRFAGNAYPGNADFVIATDGTGFVCIGTEEDEAGATSLSALRFNFADPGLFQSVQLGPWSYIAGGLPTLYDGNTVTEVGFINPPNAPTVGFGSGATVLPTITALTYQLVYVQQDANGNVHRSPPSAPVVVNASGGYPSAQLAIIPYAVTFRQDVSGVSNAIQSHPVRIEIYRNNSGAGLTVMQLLASIPNDPTVDILLYTDTTADAAGVTAAPLLYTTGGAVPSDGPPNLSALAEHATRVFGVSEDGVTAYFTTAFVRGEAPRFTDAFTISWPEGPLSAMWSLEQRLHASTQEDIWYTFGDGPNDNGAGSDFQLPSLWQASIGVVDPRGICLYPGGALLSTLRGLYAEDRGGTFTRLSQARRTLAANPVVTGMTPLDNDHAIRINIQAAPGINQSGLTLHWDWEHQKWSQHLAQNITTNGALSSCVAGGIYYLLSNVLAAVLYQESQSLYTDVNGTPFDIFEFVPIQLVTGWADMAGEQGSARVHRVMLLGQSYTPHGMTIETARDYSPTFDTDIGVWGDAAISAMSLEQMRHTPTQQKGQAFSVRLTEQAPTTGAIGTGQGPTMRNLLLRTRERRGEWKRTTVGQQS